VVVFARGGILGIGDALMRWAGRRWGLSR
jgi:hypothetical protein